MSKASKRRYRNTLDYIESGFQACWRNTLDLVEASNTLLEKGLHAPALSLSVLALEELAKLRAIDGLLYARHDDHKTQAYIKAGKSHSAKLIMFEMTPVFLGNLAMTDPRYENDEVFAKTLVISIENLRRDGNEVMAKLEKDAFLRLDEFKQTGFYVSASQNGFVAPRDSVDRSFAEMVYRLAWRATTTLDFLLKGGNLKRYIANARAIRASLSEAEHQELERIGKEVFKDWFGDPDL
jgi:AbiV family abortive infection protein